MLYRYKCPVCKVISAVEQTMGEVHSFECCGVESSRLFEGLISFTQPFYSDELGREVSSLHDWERQKEEQRYRHRTDKDLYGFSNTKDEWREKYERVED